MLSKCKSVLLLTDVESFANTFRKLAESIEVEVAVASEWQERYRVSDETVVLGSKFLPFLNESYYAKAVLILRADEDPFTYLKQGITRFVFDYTNENELLLSMFRAEPVVLRTQSREVKELVQDYGTTLFHTDTCDFRFDKDVFFYKKQPIYLCDSQKKYLAEWLIGGHKDNRKRMILCNLRKKFGADFLADVDRFGNQIRRIEHE